MCRCGIRYAHPVRAAAFTAAELSKPGVIRVLKEKRELRVSGIQYRNVVKNSPDLRAIFVVSLGITAHAFRLTCLA
jgi:hypothetical protein